MYYNDQSVFIVGRDATLYLVKCMIVFSIKNIGFQRRFVWLVTQSVVTSKHLAATGSPIVRYNFMYTTSLMFYYLSTTSWFGFVFNLGPKQNDRRMKKTMQR